MSKAVPAEVGAADSDLSTESKRPAVNDSLSKIEDVAKELGLLDEIFAVEYPELKSEAGELKRIGEDVEKLKALISEASREKQPPPHDGESLDQPEWAALENDDDILTNNAKNDILTNNAKKSLSEADEHGCLLCLVEFPEMKAIKKRPLIYWWIGEDLVKSEEEGERVFQKLLKYDCIRPTGGSSFMVYPWVRRMTFREPRSKRVFLKLGNNDINGHDQHQQQDPPITVVNLENQYLGAKLEGLSQRRSVTVLQLGRWQDSATYHIEVEDYKTYLDGLDSQKQLKYLSLRGISRIETLPRSIKKLAALQILDLRACHNLENLPSGISELKNLTHLDVSECYLLDSMPKGIESLSLLQVLKGFVVSSSGRKSCKIADLDRLRYLRKLTIRLGNAKQQFPSFNKFEALRILAISWSVAGPNSADSNVLPKYLSKLDLRCVPFEKVPEWLKPVNLPKTLEKLYIKGGKLRDLNHYDYGNIKFLRLGYLKGLEKNH